MDKETTLGVAFVVKNPAESNLMQSNGRRKEMARHGENIRKRKDGRWEGRYRIFYKEKGRNVYRSVYGKSYEEAKKKLAIAKFDSTSHKVGKQQTQKEAGYDMRNRVNEGKKGGIVLFSQAAEEWLEEVAGKRKYSTYVKYNTIYRIHLAEIIGPCRICTDEADNFQTKISNHLFEKEISESLQKSVYCVANQILGFANRKYSVGISLMEAQSL